MAQQSSFEGEVAFKVMEASFKQAMRRHPDSVFESFYTFAGQSVRMRIVGCELAKYIGYPFSHLQTDGPIRTAPQLTIDLWDEKETDIVCHVRSMKNDPAWTVGTAMSRDGRFLGQQLPNTLIFFDRRAKRIVGSMAWSDQVFLYERGKPLARLLVEWYKDQNVPVIHAGLVSRNGQGILFTGQAGSGKSTSTLACLCGGLKFLSEDYIGLQRLQDRSFMGHSLYNSVFLETDHLARFPDLVPYVIRGRLPYEEKSLIVLSQVFPKQLERVAPIRVLVLPRVVNESESRIRPATKGQALLALGPNSMLRLPSRGIAGFDMLAQLVEEVPTYWLELGHDLESVPRRVAELLAEVCRS